MRPPIASMMRSRRVSTTCPRRRPAASTRATAARMRGSSVAEPAPAELVEARGSTRTGAARAARAPPRPGRRGRSAASVLGDALDATAPRVQSASKAPPAVPARAGPPRPSTTSPKCAVTRRALCIQRRGERRPSPAKPIARGEARAPAVVVRQRVRLRVIRHLQAVLDAAQEGIGLRRARDRLRRQQLRRRPGAAARPAARASAARARCRRG